MAHIGLFWCPRETIALIPLFSFERASCLFCSFFCPKMHLSASPFFWFFATFRKRAASHSFFSYRATPAVSLRGEITCFCTTKKPPLPHTDRDPHIHTHTQKKESAQGERQAKKQSAATYWLAFLFLYSLLLPRWCNTQGQWLVRCLCRDALVARGKRRIARCAKHAFTVARMLACFVRSQVPVT